MKLEQRPDFFAKIFLKKITTLMLKLKTTFKPLRWYTVCTPFLHAYTLII